MWKSIDQEDASIRFRRFLKTGARFDTVQWARKVAAYVCTRCSLALT